MNAGVEMRCLPSREPYTAGIEYFEHKLFLGEIREIEAARTRAASRADGEAAGAESAAPLEPDGGPPPSRLAALERAVAAAPLGGGNHGP
jgi:hypothetical protein